MDAAYTAYREIRIEENRKRRLRIVRRQRIILALVIALIVFFSAYMPTGPGKGQSRRWAMVPFTRRAVV